MGQAKLRGTFEQRRNEAITKQTEKEKIRLSQLQQIKKEPQKKGLINPTIVGTGNLYHKHSSLQIAALLAVALAARS